MKKKKKKRAHNEILSVEEFDLAENYIKWMTHYSDIECERADTMVLKGKDRVLDHSRERKTARPRLKHRVSHQPRCCSQPRILG